VNSFPIGANRKLLAGTIDMVCWATGGPQKYTGKSMADSHKNLKITGTEWEAFLDDFQQLWISSKYPRRNKPN
jgi:hypothetical protein